MVRSVSNIFSPCLIPIIFISAFDEPEDIGKREEEEARERRMQRAMLDIKNRFGHNAILKGTSYQDAATGIERNKSIGGHHE